MPSQPKTDLAKLRSQISRRADDSFPVFAHPVWHAGHADREAIWVWHALHVGRHAGHEIGMPSITDFDVRCSTNRDIHIIAKYISGELEVTGFMPGNKSRF